MDCRRTVPLAAGEPCDDPLADAIAGERSRLTRLCAWLTRHPEVAEDLAQETLYEALRSRDRLADPEALSPWLGGIARNVCRRWQQSQRRAARTLPLDGAEDPIDEQMLAAPVEDVLLELERAELAALLDRALALLPPDTREVLVQRYVEESPHAEIAARLGLHEGTVRMRLQRGHLALRRVLTANLRTEVVDYLPPRGPAFALNALAPTRLWCPICGRRHLYGYLAPDASELELRCLSCGPEPEATVVHTDQAQAIIGPVTMHKPAFTRIMAWGHSYYRDALASQRATCRLCGGQMVFQPTMPQFLPPRLREQPGMQLTCTGCGDCSYIGLSGLALWLPEVRAFWRAYPRMRTLPRIEIEHQGVPAYLTRFESVEASARLDVISAREDFAVLALSGALPVDAARLGSRLDG